MIRRGKCVCIFFCGAVPFVAVINSAIFIHFAVPQLLTLTPCAQRSIVSLNHPLKHNVSLQNTVFNVCFSVIARLQTRPLCAQITVVLGTRSPLSRGATVEQEVEMSRDELSRFLTGVGGGGGETSALAVTGERSDNEGARIRTSSSLRGVGAAKTRFRARVHFSLWLRQPAVAAVKGY